MMAWARPDARTKVVGAARYAADLSFDRLVHGRFATSGIAKGRVRIDAALARQVPGVLEVLLPGDLGPIGPVEHWAAGQSSLPLTDDRVRHEGQPIALALAESEQAARDAVERLHVEYTAEPGEFALERLERGVEIDDWAASTSSVGAVAAGLAGADVRIEGRYRTADRHHAAIEPAGVIAVWQGERLELWTSTQWVFGVRGVVAQVLGIPAEQVRVRAPFVGGGFGAKGSTWPHEIFAALAARRLGRPVRIVLPREHTFTAHGYQPATEQRITLGATRDGLLTAIHHESWSAAARDDDYIEHGSLGSRSMYACPNIETSDLVVRLDRPQPTFMRAPHEGPGMVGLEIAMDELAYAAGMDPLALRIRNYAERDPTSGRPFSSKALSTCYSLGAERFGWAGRNPAPKSMRDGGLLVGWGMASALMSTFRFGSSARVTLRRDGAVLVESAAHEIGTGVQSVLATIAAEALGVSPDRITVALGDTALPEAGGTFGSATTIGVGSAVAGAATKLKQRLESLAGEPGLEPHEYTEVLSLRRLDQVSEDASWAPQEAEKAFAMNAYGSVFVEVRLDPMLPVPRVTRCVGAYSVGRIVNPIPAKSQLIGGLTWGIGQALLEESTADPRRAQFVGKGYSSYRVPVSADVPNIEVIFADEFDPHASPLGARGVGEIGTIGVGAAIANAVFHATGVRVRDVPIRVEHLLGGAAG